MRLRYENTINDLLAFQEFHYAHSPTMQRVMAKQKGAAVLVVFVLICLLPGKQSTAINIFMALVGAGIYALILPSIIRRNIKKHVLKMYAEGSNKGSLGEHELEIAADGLVERSPYNETKTAWGAVERIESTQEHKNRLAEGDFRAFLAQVGQRFQPDQRLQFASETNNNGNARIKRQ